MERVEEKGWRIVGRGMGRVEEEGKKEIWRGWRRRGGGMLKRNGEVQ